MTKRIVFSFDDKSYEALVRLQADLGTKSLAETVRQSLEMMSLLDSQAEEGYSEIVLRNKAEKKEKTILAAPFVKRARNGDRAPAS